MKQYCEWKKKVKYCRLGQYFIFKNETKHKIITSIPYCGSAINSVFVKNTWATLSIASCDHSSYQSIVQQFKSAGFIRHRCRKRSPAGLIVSAMCKYCRTRWMKNWYTAARVSGISASVAVAFRSIVMPSNSSLSNKSGTSPEFRMQLMSSKNDS